jgi:hypothetical protein
MGLTEKQIQRRWDANVEAVQAAKRRLAEAVQAVAEAELAHARYFAPLRRRAFMGQLTEAEVDGLDAAEAEIRSARDAKAVAIEEHEAAKVLFKAGVV